MRKTFPAIMFYGVLLFSLSACDIGGGHGSTTPESFSSPARVAAVGPDSLIVTDYAENKFCLVDTRTLSVMRCFPAKGQPTGIAYANYKGGRYFVGNRSVRSVDIFDSQGTFLGHLGGKTGLFDLVNDLAVNETAGYVYVLDSKSARIDVYDLDGNLFESDLTSGGLERPSAIECGADGYIYVSDFGDPGTPGTSTLDFSEVPPTIWVFDLNGSLVGSIVGSASGGMGMPGTPVFSTPQGMYRDLDNNLFVVDALSAEIQIYDLVTKNQVKVVGALGLNEGELYYPLDVFVAEPSKDVFVTDNRNGRVVVYRGGGVIP